MVESDEKLLLEALGALEMSRSYLDAISEKMFGDLFATSKGGAE